MGPEADDTLVVLLAVHVPLNHKRLIPFNRFPNRLSEAPASGHGNVCLQLIGDPINDLVDVSHIRDLNDQLRRSLTGGMLVMTRGIMASECNAS